MNKVRLAWFGRSGMLALMLLFTLVTMGGCESKGKTEFVGFPKSFADLAEKVQPAVVNISTTSTVTVPGDPFHQFFGQDQGGQNAPFDQFFKNFFNEIPDRKMKQQSLGSGFIINKDGYIITNNHVVDNADEIKVKLSDGREFKAKVIGRDSKTDLALIKISSIFKDLPTLSLGDSEKMRVIVVSVDQGSLADEAGIQPGDVIKEVNRKKVGNLPEFNEAMAKAVKASRHCFCCRGENRPSS